MVVKTNFKRKREMQNGLFSKSDMKFIHLLAIRGVSFNDAYDLLMVERGLKRSNKGMSRIFETFSKVAKIDPDEVKTSRKRPVVWIRQMFCHYISETTDISNVRVGSFLSMDHSTVQANKKRIKNDIESGYKPTIDFLEKIKKEMTH